MNKFFFFSTLLLLLHALVLSVNSQSRGEYYTGQQQQQPLHQLRQFIAPNPSPVSQQQQQLYYQQQQKYPTTTQNQQQYLNQQQQAQSYQVQQQQQQQVYKRPVYDTNRPQIQQQQQQQQIPVYQNQNQKQTPQLAQRFDGMMRDDPSSYGNGGNNDFTTRRPPSTTVQRVTKPPIQPPVFSTRFDDINSRKLTWDETLSLNTEQFALRLFAFLTHYETENIMISPYSIHSLLVVLAEGAAGKTYEELNNALGLVNRQRTRDFHQYTNLALNSKNASDVSIRKFSAMIGDKNRPVTREYEDNVEKIYDVEYIPVIFQDVENTLRTVNDAVSRSTDGQITDAVSRDDLLKAQLILLAGVNFKGNWKNVFNKTFTKNEPFYDFNQERVTGRVNMMFQRGPFAYAANQNLGCYLLELPYGVDREYAERNGLPEGSEDRISMIVILPKRGLSLVEAIDNVNKYGIKSLLLELKKAKEEFEDEEVEVHLPRFELDTSLNLKETLQDMNINEIFENSANLSGINNNYYVSSIIHKTKIRVDEKGTEAAAVTTSIFANKATPPKFHANRPFFYLIVDKATRLILFAGVYRNPTVF